jgi:hypothetical protein
MEGLTYHQILAQTYEENAKDSLYLQNEYEDDVDEHEEHDYEDQDLPDKEEFNKFHGDRGKPEHVIQPKATEKPKITLKRDTDVRNMIINVDSIFRGSAVPFPVTTNPPEDYTTGAPSSWFVFNASRIYKNITSVKLTSLEFPNTFYSFSSSRGNTTFTIIYHKEILPYIPELTITVPDGNYLSSATNLTLDPGKLVLAIRAAIRSATQDALTQIAHDTGITHPLSENEVGISYDSATHRILFFCARQFTIEFPSNPSSAYNNGIGYNLGFYRTLYDSILPPTTNLGLNPNQINGDVWPDVVQDKYIYLSINDWNLIDHQNINQTSFPAFAKIQLPGTKNTIIFDNNYTNSSTKEYFFQQPVNIQRLEIKLLDAYGNILNTSGENWSMTLELKQVNDSSTYEALNQL